MVKKIKKIKWIKGEIKMGFFDDMDDLFGGKKKITKRDYDFMGLNDDDNDDDDDEYEDDDD